MRGGRRAARRESVFSLVSEPVRRALFEHVAMKAEPVERDEAAAALGISRALAAFHLDKLVRAGFLRAGTRSRTGRGPGRPPKVYEASADISLSVPPRNYGLAAGILARAVAAKWPTLSHSVGSTARAQGQAAGARVAARMAGRRSRRHLASALQAELEQLGYAPRLEDKTIVMRNCPYLALSQTEPATICHMNGEFLAGLAEAVGGSVRMVPNAENDPARGCCATLQLQG